MVLLPPIHIGTLTTMHSHTCSVAIAQGDGLVARFGDIVVYVLGEPESALRLFAIAESASAQEHPGDTISELLTAEVRAELPAAFGAVGPAADSIRVLGRGGLSAEIETAHAARRLSDSEGSTWFDEVVVLDAGTSTIRIGSEPSVVGSRHTDLRSGIVLGGGFVLSASCSAAPQQGNVETVPPHTMVPTEHTQASPSPAMTAASTAVQPLTMAGAAVEGEGPGALIAADGSAYPLDRSYVIGRDPMKAAEVRNSAASPIVTGDDRHVSRVHAFVSVDGDTVLVRDNATPGGTYVAAPNVQQWTQIGSTAERLKPGWRIMIGEQIYTYGQ